MPDDKVPICPECGSYDIYRHRGGYNALDHEHEFDCHTCGWSFDDPDTKDREESKNAAGGLAQRLEDYELDSDQ